MSQILLKHPDDAIYIADTENHRVLRFGDLELFFKGVLSLNMMMMMMKRAIIEDIYQGLEDFPSSNIHQ